MPLLHFPWLGNTLNIRGSKESLLPGGRVRLKGPPGKDNRLRGGAKRRGVVCQHVSPIYLPLGWGQHFISPGRKGRLRSTF